MRLRYIMVYILTILFLVSLLASESIASPTSNVKNVKVGQTFTIALHNYPSSGYHWNAIYTTAYLEIVNQSFQPDTTDPRIIGAGGNEIFTFKAVKPGNTTIIFNQQRSQETPANTETYDIKITANNAKTGNNITNDTENGANRTTIPLQDTGVPLTGLAVSILAVLGGIIGSMKK